MDISLDHVRFFDEGSGLHAVLAIEAFPEVAQKIGILLASFAVAELTLRDLLARALDISQDEAHDVLGHLQSVSLRAKVIESVASTDPDKEIKKKIRGLLSEIRWLANERNKYAHAQYGAPQDNEDHRLFRVSFFTDTRKTLFDEMTDEKLNSDIERAKALISVLWETLRT